MGVSIAFCGATTLMHEYYSVSPWLGVADCVWQGENMRRRSLSVSPVGFQFRYNLN